MAQVTSGGKRRGTVGPFTQTTKAARSQSARMRRAVSDIERTGRASGRFSRQEAKAVLGAISKNTRRGQAAKRGVPGAHGPMGR